MSAKSLKILIVSLFFTYPEVTHSGGTDLFNYIKSLKARGHQISLVSFIKAWETPYVDSMRFYCDEIVTIPATSTFFQRILKSPSLLQYPLQWVEAYSNDMRFALRKMLSTRQYDLVHIEHLWMGQYRPLFDEIPTVLDEVDVDSIVLFRRYQVAKSAWHRFYLIWNWVRTQQIEAELGKQFNLIFTRSEKDQKYMQCLLPGIDIRVLPPWFEGINRSKLPVGNIEPYSILFVGNMSRSPNIDAVMYFIKSIFQKILIKVPEAKLYVVGDAPPEKLRKLANEHIIITGYVDRLEDYYDRCQVFIAPLLTGGGIIVKILDALSAGRPVVCSSIANEGIEALPGRDICIANSPNDFAEAVIRLINDKEYWINIINNGRQFFEARYNWDKIVNNLEQAYFDTVTKASVKDA